MKTLQIRRLNIVLVSLLLLSAKATGQVMPFGIFHAAQAAQIAGRDNISLVVEVTTATGKIWMDRNLGATRVATSSTDEASYGDLHQWGRGADGHQKRTSTTTTIRSSTNIPGNASFILAPLNADAPYDWRNPQI